MQTIHTPRLTLRPLSPTDEDALLALLRHPAVGETYMVPDLSDPQTAQRLFQRIMTLSHDDAHFVRAIDLQGHLIGLINDTEITGPTMELGWAIHPDHHGRGYCTEAVTAALQALFAQGYTEITAGAFPTNLASLRVMQKCGMALLSKRETITYRGRSYNCIFYAAHSCKPEERED
ncbi:MAG: GNAT family N-acetyltransferase [Clostridia bacterium]|nr:GNAT family N-acetyltransferase [Clostridia bacterium]